MLFSLCTKPVSISFYLSKHYQFHLLLPELQIDIMTSTASSVSVTVPQKKTTATMHFFIIVATGVFSFLSCCCVCYAVCLIYVQQGASGISIAGYSTQCCVQFMKWCIQWSVVMTWQVITASGLLISASQFFSALFLSWFSSSMCPITCSV